MVVDRLANAEKHHELGANVKRGLEFLAETDLAAIPLGRHEVDGQQVIAIVEEYTPKPEHEGFLEAHERYIDIQYMVSGSERMGLAKLRDTQPDGPYDEERDLQRLKGKPHWITLDEGQFAVVFPEDAHMPGIDNGPPATVRKVVVKVAVETEA